MKKMIMFVTYDFSDVSSGSKVRPLKMYNAFKSIGYEVFLISGNKESKKRDFKKLQKENKEFDFCYIEPSSYPMQPFIDYKVINYIKKLNIPIGIFYRDAYWKFYNSLENIKKMELYIRYRFDLIFFKKMSDVMFFPSAEMSKHFNFKQPKIPLPPASDKRKIPEKRQNVIPKAIYVGGISKRYGTELLLNSFKKINRDSKNIDLLFVCRKNEYEANYNLFKKYEGSSWLEIKHVAGDMLENEYAGVDFGVIPILKDNYNDFAVPVKLFEYLSHRLPIISTNCLELKKYISEHNLGYVETDNTEDFGEGILKIALTYSKFHKNIDAYVEKFGTWEHRAIAVEENLLKKDTI